MHSALLGRKTTVELHYNNDTIRMSATVTGVGGPLVQVQTRKGNIFYRHRDTIIDRLRA